MAAQLVAFFVFSVQCEVAYGNLAQNDAMKSVVIHCVMPITYPIFPLVVWLLSRN